MDVFDKLKIGFARQRPDIFLLCTIIWNGLETPRRTIIYMLHLAGKIDLKARGSSEYSNDDLAALLDEAYPDLYFKTADLRELTGLSKGTFIKYFSFWTSYEVGGARKFKVSEVFKYLKEWGKEEYWYFIPAVSKGLISELLYGGNQNRLQRDLEAFYGDESFTKNHDYIPPKVLFSFLNHTDRDRNRFVAKVIIYLNRKEEVGEDI